MANSTLLASSPLNGFAQHFGDTQLREVIDLDIVSLAVPSGSQAALSTRLQDKLGLSLPAPGKTQRHGDDIVFLGLQSDQCFVVTRTRNKNPVAALKDATGEAAYLTDQSDSWVILELEGPLAHPALERICPVDLSDNVFDQQSLARTTMEHLSVIIERPRSNLFRLYSPRSSARSFLHAMSVSLHNVSSPCT